MSLSPSSGTPEALSSAVVRALTYLPTVGRYGEYNVAYILAIRFMVGLPAPNWVRFRPPMALFSRNQVTTAWPCRNLDGLNVIRLDGA
jgi:hypothetical protein